ncbi:MAG: tyrosine-type recombinase/integrase [Magnetococcales bacterium]|nr:tyrosine-type recombinase/integrase [Magnetococcales bacterium]
MDFAYLTGQRVGDLLDVRFEDLHDDGIFVSINKSGNRVKIRIGWNDDLRSVVHRLRCRAERYGTVDYLFAGRGEKPLTYFGISCMFRRAAKKAGVEDFHFHDIRAKALTDLKLAGGDAQGLAGHQSAAMTDHYIKRREIPLVQGVKNLVRLDA